MAVYFALAKEAAMRFQIQIDDKLVELLEALAWREKRQLRQQAELLLETAIREAVQGMQPALETVNVRD
jgi:hypothetical protein